MARQAVEILGRRMNATERKFKTLEDFTLEETENIRTELEGRQQAEFEMKEATTSLGVGLWMFLTQRKPSLPKTVNLRKCLARSRP